MSPNLDALASNLMNIKDDRYKIVAITFGILATTDYTVYVHVAHTAKGPGWVRLYLSKDFLHSASFDQVSSIVVDEIIHSIVLSN